MGQYALFFGAYNDHCIRAEIKFCEKIDADILLAALNKTIDLVPIIKSKWVETRLKTYWEIIDGFDIKNYFTFYENQNDFTAKNPNENLAENFMTEKINEKDEAQIKVMLFRKNNKDKLLFLFNHQSFDAASLKDFLILIARFYTGLTKDKNYTITDFVCGDRRFNQLFKGFSFREKIKLFFRNKHGEKNSKRLGFPYEKNATAIQKRIIKSTYSEEFFLN